MEGGSGDGAQSASLVKEEIDEQARENLESVHANIARLRLKSESEGKIDEKWDVGTETDDTSSEDSSTVEPICSYPYGYLKRQTVYTCITCNDPTKENWQPAGICIGCSYACHQGHEVISMETRRNFRCDCGNKKFSKESACILCPDKDDVNESNVYNDNYKGTFCTCNCKEADCDAKDPLYQCVVCEDWFHAGHCDAKTEGIEKNYTDLVCGGCTTKLDFLRYYEPFDPEAVVDDNAISEMMNYSQLDESVSEKAGGDNGANEDEGCKLETLAMKDPYPTGQLWTLGWRGKLCRCDKCKEMYAKLNVSFLLDKDDETRRYFSEEDDEETQKKVCALVRKFEEWMFTMDPKERTDMFELEPQQVKDKMREYFEKSKKEGEDDFIFDDTLLDQLFDSFAEFILDAEGGDDYLMDMDALATVFGEGMQPESNEKESGDKEEESNPNLTSSNIV